MTSKLTYDEPRPSREASLSLVSFFTLNTKTQSTNWSYIKSTHSQWSCVQVVHLWSSFSSCPSHSGLSSFPLWCFSLKHQHEGTHMEQINISCMNLYMHSWSQWCYLYLFFYYIHIKKTNKTKSQT